MLGKNAVHRLARPLEKRRFVGPHALEIGAPPRLDQLRNSEDLRGLRETQTLAGHGVDHHATIVDTLDGVGNLGREDCARSLAEGADHLQYILRVHQRAGSVVHRHHLRTPLCGRLNSDPNRVLAPGAAGDEERLREFGLQLITPCIEPLSANNHHQRGFGKGAGESAEGMSKDGAGAERLRQLVPAESRAATPADANKGEF